MQNYSKVVFISSSLDWKYPFWENLVQEIKIFSFSWNLVLSPTQIWKIQWWCSLFLYHFEWKHSFYGKFVSKNQIACWSWNLKPRLILKWKMQWWFSFYTFLTGNTLFGLIWSKNQNCQCELQFGTWTISKVRWWQSFFLF